MCEEIMPRRLAPLHRNSQSITALHGILEDFITLLAHTETSYRSERAPPHSTVQVLETIGKDANYVMANRSTAREERDHHDPAAPREDEPQKTNKTWNKLVYKAQEPQEPRCEEAREVHLISRRLRVATAVTANLNAAATRTHILKTTITITLMSLV